MFAIADKDSLTVYEQLIDKYPLQRSTRNKGRNESDERGAVSLRDTFVQASKKLSLRTSDRRHWCGNPPE